MLTLGLCRLIRTHRAVLEKQDAQNCCSFISKLGREASCVEASELCAQASKVVQGSEKTYLELCEQSCKKCSESRQPKKKPLERITDVAYIDVLKYAKDKICRCLLTENNVWVH